MDQHQRFLSVRHFGSLDALRAVSILGVIWYHAPALPLDRQITTDAGASGVHFEDQLASVKKCGHMGGKVLVPTREAVSKLVAARLAADVMGTPTILLARTDAEAADLVTSDVDDNDKPFMTGERTVEGFFKSRNGL